MGLGKTEWEDILIEKGIIAAPKDTQIDQHPDIIYDTSNRDEVDALFDEENDDAFLQHYKDKQIALMRHLQAGQIFGTLEEISRSDFVAEVTEASKKHPVLVFLYQTSNVNCQVLGKWLAQHAAPANPSLKFVQILSTRCIQNYPDANLPTILLYRLGGVQKQVLQADALKTQALIGQVLEAEKETRDTDSRTSQDQ